MGVSTSNIAGGHLAAGRLSGGQAVPGERSSAALRVRSRRTLRSALVFAALLTWFTVLPVFAQDTQATVRVDGRALFRVGDGDGLEATARRDGIQRRLAAVLENPDAIGRVTVQRDGPGGTSRTVSVAARPIVTVAPADAADTGLSTDQIARQWAQAIDQALQRGAQRRRSAGNRFVAEVQACVETAFARLLESTITVVPRALAALLVIGAFWALATGVRALMRIIFRRFVSDLTVENLIKQVAYYSVWVLGLIVAANAFGLEPQTLVTGLGLTSLALGFALKDILSNFVSGLLLLTLRPFRIGDEIVIGDPEGTVERIELRATQMRTYDGRRILVPNAEVFTSRVTNNTAAPVRRGSVEVFVGYDADLSQAADAMREAARRTDGVLAEPPVSVRVRDLGQDDAVLEVRFWTDSRRSDYVATASLVRWAVVQEFNQRQLPLPDPDVRVLVPRAPERWREALGRDGASE